MGEYQGDKDGSAVLPLTLVFQKQIHETMTPCSVFQIFGFSNAGLIIGASHLKRPTQKILIFCTGGLRRPTAIMKAYF
jgi:hypothetical protein